MALAYAVVFVNKEIWEREQRMAVQEAQRAADQRFSGIAEEARLTLVTRNPEPRVMTYLEMRNAFPYINLDGLVGLFFTADIS